MHVQGGLYSAFCDTREPDPGAKGTGAVPAASGHAGQGTIGADAAAVQQAQYPKVNLCELLRCLIMLVFCHWIVMKGLLLLALMSFSCLKVMLVKAFCMLVMMKIPPLLIILR
jgi:hypothetical protein